MADSIKIGSLDISAFKVGSDDCKVYLGDTLLYPQSPTPPGPTPIYEWKQYNEGDTVPSKLFYGVKLGDPSMNEASIEFGDALNTDIGFIFDNGVWYAQDLSGEQIDLTEYFDETEGCYIIYFSDLRLGAMPLYIPAPSGSFDFDVQLYEEAPQSPQWVTFSNGDTISSDLEIYGIKGVVNDLSRVFYMVDDGIYFELDKGNYNVYIGDYARPCYVEDGIASNTSVEYTFSNIGCSDYYTISSKTISNMSDDIQLLIYP